jgi:hypothetical protein
VKEQTEGRVSRGGDCEISDVEDLSFCVCMSKEGEAEEAGSVYLSSNDVCQNFPILCSNEDLSVAKDPIALLKLVCYSPISAPSVMSSAFRMC